jgi:hypothetical protein
MCTKGCIHGCTYYRTNIEAHPVHETWREGWKAEPAGTTILHRCGAGDVLHDVGSLRICDSFMTVLNEEDLKLGA